jgi:hypothetical protein
MFKAFWVWNNERKLDTPKELQRLTTKHGFKSIPTPGCGDQSIGMSFPFSRLSWHGM